MFNMHNILIKLISGLIILGGALAVLQIWDVDIMSWDIFLKVIMTLGVIVLVLGFLLVVKMDFGEHKKLKDDGYID